MAEFSLTLTHRSKDCQIFFSRIFCLVVGHTSMAVLKWIKKSVALRFMFVKKNKKVCKCEFPDRPAARSVWVGEEGCRTGREMSLSQTQRIS